MGLSHNVSKIDGDFGRKSQNFLTPVYFVPQLKGFPLEFGTSTECQKTRMMGLPGRERSLTISSAVWIQSTNVTDGQIDGRTPGDSKDRTYASHRTVKIICLFITLHAKLSGAVYCNWSCLWVCVCGSVTTITRNCVHRSSPNWVC